MKRGRPRKPVDPLKVARMVGLLGGTTADLACALDVTSRGLEKRHGELVRIVKESKAEADAQVEKSLFKRAVGYSCPDTHFSTFEGQVIATPYTKHYPPSEVACIFWLKNRKPDQWREKSEVHLQTEIAGLPDKVLSGLRKLAATAFRPK